MGCSCCVGTSVLHPLLNCNVGDSDERFKYPLVLLLDSPGDGCGMVPFHTAGWSQPYPGTGLASDHPTDIGPPRNWGLELSEEVISGPLVLQVPCPKVWL